MVGDTWRGPPVEIMKLGYFQCKKTDELVLFVPL
jgi:hypothetical protein